MQRRSESKITFPNLWTNTCCSHNAHVESELQNDPDFIGMRRAAVRRVKFELGIDELDAEKDLKVGSRILYHADSCETFTEYELDYIIFCKKELTRWNIAETLNRDEIENIQWVPLHEFENYLAE